MGQITAPPTATATKTSMGSWAQVRTGTVPPRGTTATAAASQWQNTSSASTVGQATFAHQGTSAYPPTAHTAASTAHHPTIAAASSAGNGDWNRFQHTARQAAMNPTNGMAPPSSFNNPHAGPGSSVVTAESNNPRGYKQHPDDTVVPQWWHRPGQDAWSKDHLESGGQPSETSSATQAVSQPPQQQPGASAAADQPSPTPESTNENNINQGNSTNIF